MSFPTHVNIVEVGPRDGLQNEAKTIATETKVALIHALADAGLRCIESTSFVSPKWVPQMADHTAVMQTIDKKPGVRYLALVPNLKGLEAAIAAGVTDIAVFAAASESFSQKNINCSIADSLIRIGDVIAQAKQQHIRVRGYVSCVLGCPYEGDITTQAVIQVSEQLLKMGCYEISLGDTIGVGTPNKAQQLIHALSEKIPMEQLAVHFHNTYGQALVNIYACLELGISTVDASVAGLGGCPYAPGASGNVATEDVVYMLNGLGINTGVDLDALIQAGMLIKS